MMQRGLPPFMTPFERDPSPAAAEEAREHVDFESALLELTALESPDASLVELEVFHAAARLTELRSAK